MQLHIRKQMDDNISILSKAVKSNESSQYANDPEFLKLSKFMECSDKFITFIDEYATALFKDDSEFWDKWENNNSKENNRMLYKLAKSIGDEDINVKYLAKKIPQLRNNLNKYFDNVYQFVRKEIENYKHYVKAIKYSQEVTGIEEEKIEYLKGYHIPKYDNNVSYDKYSMKMKEYESRLSR